MCQNTGATSSTWALAGRWGAASYRSMLIALEARGTQQGFRKGNDWPDLVAAAGMRRLPVCEVRGKGTIPYLEIMPLPSVPKLSRGRLRALGRPDHGGTSEIPLGAFLGWSEGSPGGTG